jgi:hypothetical protein
LSDISATNSAFLRHQAFAARRRELFFLKAQTFVVDKIPQGTITDNNAFGFQLREKLAQADMRFSSDPACQPDSFSAQDNGSMAANVTYRNIRGITQLLGPANCCSLAHRKGLSRQAR